MKTRLAVIGSGFGLYGLLPAFQQVADCEVVGLCGKSSPRLVDYCQKTSVPVFHDWREMIDTVQPDAIAVAVVPKHQYEILKYAFERRISAFAEKPLSVDLAQAEELLRLAQSKKLAHMVDFIFPEIPEWKKAKELLPAIGQIQTLKVDWKFVSYDVRNKIDGWKTKPEEGGGALSFYFCHVFHNLEFFLGPIENFSCRLTRSPLSVNSSETGVDLQVKFKNGATAEVVFDCASSETPRHTLGFIGTNGRLALENSTAGFTEFVLRHSGQAVETPNLSSRPGDDPRVAIVLPLAERFIRWCQKGAAAKPDFADGVRVQELIAKARTESESV